MLEKEFGIGDIEAVEQNNQPRSINLPRPLYSGSPAFEAAYTLFVKDVFTRDVSTVRFEEDSTQRSLILAGCRKIVANKKSGQLHLEILLDLHADTAWKKVKFSTRHDLTFIAHPASIRQYLISAWSDLFGMYLSKPETYFSAENMPYDAYKIEYKFADFVRLAAQRRLGGKDKNMIAIKTYIHFLWHKLVDRDIVRLCLHYFGHSATFGHYNLVVKRIECFKRFESETPNLTPLIGSWCANRRSEISRSRIPTDVVVQAKKWLLSDVAPIGWRFLTHRNRLFVKTVVSLASQKGDRQSRYISVGVKLNILGSVGEVLPLSFVKWFLNRAFDKKLVAENYSSIVRFIRLAGHEALRAKKQKRLNRFLLGDFNLALDWFIGVEGVNGEDSGIKAVQKNATWSSIMRAQRIWHDTIEERRRLQFEADELAYQQHLKQLAAISWNSAIGDMQLATTTITALTTGQQLMDEGACMQHCVGNYIQSCSSGLSRIFHLESASESATVELHTTNQKKWVVRQVFGRNNKDSSIEFWSVAKNLATQYTRALKQDI